MTLRFLILLFLAPLAIAAESAVAATSDADVQALSKVQLFAFDIVALNGRSSGERALARILAREDKIRPLIEVYNRGTTEAKVYALAAFHYLTPTIFEQCRRDLVGRFNPMVRATNGCMVANGTLLEFLIRIHHGEYAAYIREYSKL